MSYWENYEQEVQERAGGGIVGKGLVWLVWKTFPSGVEQEKTVFSTVPCHKNSSPEVKAIDKAAQEAARVFGLEHGETGEPQKGLLIRMYRDHSATRGQPATWKADRFFFKADWTDAGKKVKESVKDAGITALPYEGYMRIGFFDDPYHVSLGEAGMKETDQDGNPRYPQVAYVVETFPSEEAARAALGTPAAEPAGIPFMPGDDKLSALALGKGWTWESWQGVKDEIVTKYNEAREASDRPAPLAAKEALEALAKGYDVSTEDVLLHL